MDAAKINKTINKLADILDAEADAIERELLSETLKVPEKKRP
ncbi:MAG: hypothetical protein P4L74_04715 [Candidatus Doudnabacteria bacterium]|nr:hypothetical protein [Candidatus Doudnabacteria bacterium]